MSLDPEQRRARIVASNTRWNKAHPEKMLAAVKKWKAANREKCLAHKAVDNAVRAGRLQRLPCFICGETPTHGHHAHYGLRLGVIWLCVKHHEEAHAMVQP